MAGNLTAMIAAAFSGSAAPPVTSDPYFNYTTLLLPGNGTNGAQNNTFLDGSTNNFTITRNGNTTQGAFSPFSQTGWGNYFDGSGDYLNTSYNAAFDFGTGDFTLETWFYLTAAQGDMSLIGSYDGGAGVTTGYIVRLGSNFVRFLYRAGSNTDNIIDRTVSFNPSSWNHLAVVRSSGVLTFYANGAQIGATASLTASINAVSTASYVIGQVSSANYFTGYLSNTRIVKGTAVYTSAFTPSTTPLTAISGTSLLTCQSNRFIDNSTNNFTITKNGDTRVVAFSPFNPTASWSAATYGGSGYFDGSGDYLTLSANSAFAIGTGDFTFDCWLYPLASNSGLFVMTASGVNDLVITNNWNPSTGGTTNGTAAVVFASTAITGPTNAVVQNAWNHIAVVRSSGSIRVYVNGAGGTQTTNTYNITGSYAPTIGALYTHSPSATPACYMFNMRLVKGTAVYDPSQSTITVPTTPLTAITNTSLLLNFTNAGIYDATSKNDLETVGNAQISTTQSKWGGSSMAFDGNADWLSGYNDGALLYLGTTYTIEFWLRLNSVSGTQNLIVLSASNVSNQGINCYTSGTSITVDDGNTASTGPSGGTLAINTWYHVALVANGTNTKLFIDGNTISTYAGITRYTAGGAWKYITVGVNGSKTSNYLNGYINDLRITNGVARYTANFTAPTAAFPTL